MLFLFKNRFLICDYKRGKKGKNNTVPFPVSFNPPTSICSKPEPFQHSPGGGGRGQLPRVPTGAGTRGGAGNFIRNWSSDCPWDDVREWGNVTWCNKFSWIYFFSCQEREVWLPRECFFQFPVTFVFLQCYARYHRSHRKQTPLSKYDLLLLLRIPLGKKSSINPSLQLILSNIVAYATL